MKAPTRPHFLVIFFCFLSQSSALNNSFLIKFITNTKTLLTHLISSHRNSLQNPLFTLHTPSNNMGKKNLKLSSLFKTKEISQRKQQHPWQFLPSCGHPKTVSFRVGGGGDDDIFKTVNSVFFDQTENITETPKSWFTTSSESASFSTESEEYYCYNDGESLETLVRGVKSERLFFEAEDTSSILEKAKANGFPFKESVVLAMESEDPYEDFKRSMEEMVESHGVKDWEGLEELLSWYLKVNGKNNHGFIVGAFVDLLISLAASNNSNNSCSSNLTLYSSAVSSFASSPLYLCEGQNEITEIEDNNVTAS